MTLHIFTDFFSAPQIVVSQVIPLGRFPQLLQCPNCMATVTTSTTRQLSCTGWVIVIVLLFLWWVIEHLWVKMYVVYRPLTQLASLLCSLLHRRPLWRLAFLSKPKLQFFCGQKQLLELSGICSESYDFWKLSIHTTHRHKTLSTQPTQPQLCSTWILPSHMICSKSH